jgi:oligosaccharide reducing-end xylanase
LNAGEWNRSYNLITFGPSQNFTDASYVLPLFYSEWACFDTTNASTWKSGVTAARSFFAKATDATTGLAPDQSNFDASPKGDFGSDAWRVPMNIMMDFNLNNADPWQQTYAVRHAAFWVKEGLGNYGNKYTLSGTKTSTGHGAGQVGANAMLAFALPAADGKAFVQAAWDVAIPTGQYRYYDGCLYMLSLLHLSGKFNLFY